MKKSINLLSFIVLLTSCIPSPEELIPETLKGTEAETGTTAPSPQAPALQKNILDCEEARFTTLLNLYRTQHKLGLVSISESGTEGARWHAQDMNDKNYFSHTEPDGRIFSERALAFGYPAWAENIAAGNGTAEKTFCQWKNSSGHNANMLRAEHKTIGIGHYFGDGIYRHYWVNTFGPDIQDKITEPTEVDLTCIQPVALPSC